MKAKIAALVALGIVAGVAHAEQTFIASEFAFLPMP